MTGMCTKVASGVDREVFWVHFSWRAKKSVNICSHRP